MSETNEVPTIGGQLAQARQAAGRELSGISQELCIRVRHLQALEADDFASLPATPFAVGYVRSYARLLGLDADKLADQYRAQCGATERRAELKFPEPIHESRIPSRAVMATAAAALFGIYFGWFYGTADPTVTADAVSPVPDRLKAQAETVEPAPTAQAANTAPMRDVDTGVTDDAGIPDEMKAESLLALASAQDATGRVPTRSDSTGVEPTREAAAQSAQPPQRSQVDTAQARQEPALVAEADLGDVRDERAIERVKRVREDFFHAVSLDLVPGANAAPPSDVPDGRIVLRAGTDTWILVTDADGDEVYKGVLRAGQRFTVPDLAGLRLMTSNAGGLSVFVDGEQLKPLGKRGTVLRGVVLEPERLKRGGSVAMR